MTRTEQLVFCKKCTNRDFNLTEGVLCKLTGAKATFESTCPDYELDKKTIVDHVPVATIKPNKKRAALAIQLIWAVLIVDMFTVVSDYMQYSLLLDFNNDLYVSDNDIDANDLRVQLISILYLVVYIISAVTFIQWFRRAYNNLGVRTRINNDEGWAAGAWFVPIICLFRPYRIMVELFEKTHKLIQNRTGTNEENKGKSLIGIWWALWIIIGYIGNYSIKMAFKEDTIENLTNGTLADMISSILGIPIGILAILIITAMSKKETRLLELETADKKKLEAG